MTDLIVALSGLLVLASACSSDDGPGSTDKNPDDDESAADASADGNSHPSDAGKPRMDAGVPANLDAGNPVHADSGQPAKGDGPGDSGISQPATGAAKGDWVAGDYPPDISGSTYLEIPNLPGSAGNVRQYKVHVPKGYTPTVPAPVLFCFHGLGQDAVFFCVNASGLPAKSDEEGFILVMPNGIGNSWDAGTCCSNSGLNEPEFIRAVFNEISTHLNLDAGRVYATGMSNGGYLSFRVACEMSDLFVAIAPSAGAVGIPSIGGGTGSNTTFTKCEPKQHVSVLEMHGTSDPLIPYSLQKPSLDLMAKSNGCSLETKPADIPMSAGDATCVTYTGCPPGIEVTGCSVMDGGHCWFGDPSGSCGTGAPGIGNAIVGNDSKSFVNTNAAWAFLKRLSR
jgi:polyhydroxybutyrate depolymerase